jgi:polysaccharide biosynthesis/export protein
LAILFAPPYVLRKSRSGFLGLNWLYLRKCLLSENVGEIGLSMMASKLPLEPLFWCCALIMCGCATAGPATSDIKGTAMPHEAACMTAPNYDGAGSQDPGYEIQPGDTLDISFYLNPEFDHTAIVRPDGKIALAVVGDVNTHGLTPAQLSTDLDQLYSHELRDPGAVVRVSSTPGRVVYVAGEVGHPGAIKLDSPSMTAMQAIAAAGGATDNASVSNVVLIRRDGCGGVHGEKLDLSKAMSLKDGEADVALLPTDTVIVPRSGIAQLDLIVKQYVRDVLPVQPYLSILPF